MADEVRYSVKSSQIKFTGKRYSGRKMKVIGGSVVLISVILVITLSVTLTVRKNTTFVKQSEEREIVLLVAIDGFRPEYLKRGITPNLKKLGENGVVADFMRPQFPTKTFPNHYTIVTGLYPESHGIVANSFFNENLTLKFSLSSPNKNDAHWYHGEPIWTTAKRQGRKSASFFWPGSENTNEAMRPSKWVPYNSSIPFSQRIDQVISWLKTDPSERMDMLLLYFEEPDKAGHNNGPVSKKTDEAIRRTDKTIGELVSKIHSNNLQHAVNLIVVSDHGMTSSDVSQGMNIDEKFNATVAGINSLSLLYFKNDSMFNLSNPVCDKHADVLYRDKVTVPRRLHYTNNKRIGNIILSPKPPSVLKFSVMKWPLTSKGYHGMDNLHPDLQSIFIASGPAFKQGYKAKHFPNTEVYNLITDIIGLRAAPNNGTRGSLRSLLKRKFKYEIEKEEKEPSQRYFPQTATLQKCYKCVCSYCHNDVYHDLDTFRLHLNLTKKEVLSSHTKHLLYTIPRGGEGLILLTQRSYVTAYNPQLKIPIWVSYTLQKDRLMKSVKRKNCFRRDIRLTFNESSLCSSYKHSGFDRGHMAPSGSFSYNNATQQDTFILSNIAPQYAELNRGAWRYLENRVRGWAKRFGAVNVITGSVFDYNNDGIKDNNVTNWVKHDSSGLAIPSHFYKILSRCSKPFVGGVCKGELHTLAFVLPNVKEPSCKKNSDLIKYHVSSIRDIERLTGTTFFPRMRYELRAALISRTNAEFW